MDVEKLETLVSNTTQYLHIITATANDNNKYRNINAITLL